MLVHRLKGATAAHAQFANVVFRLSPRRNPPAADEAMKVPAIADQLGVTRPEVRALVDAEVLPAERDERGNIVVTGRQLERFYKKLEPVELIEREPVDLEPPAAAADPEPTAPSDAAPVPAPPRLANPPSPAAGPPAEAAPAPPAAASAPRLVATDRGADSGTNDGVAFVAPCPSCDTPLAIQHGVLAVRCPACQRRLDVVTQEEPGDLEHGDVGGMRLFGFRVGRRKTAG